MFLFSTVIFASNTKTETSSIESRGLLFENTTVGESNGHYVSTEFATPSKKSNNINVYFDNKGASSVTVTLEKKGLFGSWSEVDSFTAEMGKKPYKEMLGASKSTYRIKVDSSSGAEIKGHLRAKQL